jgi:two-component system nitrate/nitrite response regulator NarL
VGNPIRIVVADDHPVFRKGLVRLLEHHPSTTVVAEAGDGVEALACIKTERPDVALLDVKMPRLDGMKSLAAIKRDFPDVGVILLSGYLDSETVYEAVEAGAGGYLLKTADIDVVLGAIEVVNGGGTILPPEVQVELASGIRARNERRLLLTTREQEVLTLMSEGKSAPVIGKVLNIEAATVKVHLRNLYKKLEVQDRAAAVKEAMRRGLLE